MKIENKREVKMSFEEIFKTWTLDKKVEWALGPYICNLSQDMRSIIIDLKAENERLKGEVRKWKRDSELASAMFRLVAQGKECTSTKVLEEAERVENLEKENAKLKCLALHLFERVANLTAETFTDIELEKYLKWKGMAVKYHKAHRKAKKELTTK